MRFDHGAFANIAANTKSRQQSTSVQLNENGRAPMPRSLAPRMQ